jgi:archaellum biogenesis protein FlaJ (TadC family)
MKRPLTELLSSLTWQSVLLTAAIFLATFLLSLAIVTFILVKLPPDHFQRTSKRKLFDDRQRWVRFTATIGKNVLGIILVLLGIVLSIPGVPGQGILTILLGIMLLDFPGKRHLEEAILSRPKVREAINRLRHRFGKPPLILD